MTITVKYKTLKRRYVPGMVFDADIDDVGDIIIDYSGEVGGDSVSSVSVTTSDITAGTPAISGNVVTVALSGQKETVSKIEVKMTTSSGKVLSSTVRIRATDYYNRY